MAEAESSGGTIGGSPTPRLGSYRLLEPLGTGGMSSVFRAEHIETGHEVAVKVLPRTLAKNSTMLQRFLREAKNVEALDHASSLSSNSKSLSLCRFRMSRMSPGSKDTSHDQIPKPPWLFTARTHSASA